MKLYSNPMNAYDWLMTIGYFAVIGYGLCYHTEIVIWVWLFVSYRDYINKELKGKTLGNPNKWSRR